MSSLREIQHRFRHSMLEGHDDGIESFVVADGIAAADRIAIYRNTYLAVLTRALRLNHPAIERLVGEAFFEAAAHEFIEQSPPGSAWLDQYGEGFADFVEQFPPAASIPYLADVATLEWAVACALHAEDAPSLDLTALAALMPDEQARVRFVAHPSVRLVHTRFPADAIWRAVLARDDAAMASIDLTDGPRWLLVWRSPATIEVTTLSEREWLLTAQLCAGRSPQETLDATLEADAAVLLARYLAGALFSDFRLGNELHRPTTEKLA